MGDTLGKEVGDGLGNVLGKLVGLMLRVGGVEGTVFSMMRCVSLLHSYIIVHQIHYLSALSTCLLTG